MQLMIFPKNIYRFFRISKNAFFINLNIFVKTFRVSTLCHGPDCAAEKAEQILFLKIKIAQSVDEILRKIYM